MSVQYGAISWNRQKKVYDVTLVSLLVLYLAIFVGVGIWRNPTATAETLLIRGLGTAAFLLLNVVLSGAVTFQWRRGGRVLATLSRTTSSRHTDADGADPAKHSAATCTIR